MLHTLPPAIQERLGHLSLLIFDLDGVITSESGYWGTARAAVASILTETKGFHFPIASIDAHETLITPELIARVKNRAVNSNWDLAFVALCLNAISLFDQVSGPDRSSLRQALDSSETVADFTSTLEIRETDRLSVESVERLFDEIFPTESQSTGVQVLDRFRSVIDERFKANGLLFAHKGPVWELCHAVCQTIEDRRREAGVPDEAVMAVAQLDQTLSALASSEKFTLGVATGRPRAEAVGPMEQLGLLKYFDQDRIVTYDDVADAEASLAKITGATVTLGKPHPFPLRKAIEPQCSDRHLVETPLGNYPHVAFVGDTASDVLAAKEVDVLSIGVLTGVPGGEQFRNQRDTILREAGCHVVLNDVSELPTVLGR